MRRTDFLPVGGEGGDAVLERGYDSLSDSDEKGRGLEYACEGDSAVNMDELVASVGISNDFEIGDSVDDSRGLEYACEGDSAVFDHVNIDEPVSSVGISNDFE